MSANGADAAIPAPPTTRRLALTDVRGPVGVGRDFVRRALTDWHWFPEHADPARQPLAADVLLVASELLSNACLHAGGPLALIVDAGTGSGALRIEVVDGDPEPPVPRSSERAGLPGGHGLHIVDRICDRWGVVRTETGKTVWAEVDAARLEAELSAAPDPLDLASGTES
jgi:hypothetical protein